MNAEFQSVLEAIRTIRLRKVGQPESYFQLEIAGAIERAGIKAEREVPFAPRCRADVWVNGIVVEVKKKRPPAASAIAQLERYANVEKVRGVILVLEKSLHVPESINNKPVAVVSLNSLFGIAL